MTLQAVADPSVACWLTIGNSSVNRAVSLAPGGFEAYARLRYIPDPQFRGQMESDVDIDEDHLPDGTQARTVLEQLASFTTTPNECFFGIWDGWPFADALRASLAGPLFKLPHRSYYLLAGSLTDFDRWAALDGGTASQPPPALVWPADRRWCFVCDVDPHWASIGANHDAVETLLASPNVDVVRAEPDEMPPTYY